MFDQPRALNPPLAPSTATRRERAPQRNDVSLCGVREGHCRVIDSVGAVALVVLLRTSFVRCSAVVASNVTDTRRRTSDESRVPAAALRTARRRGRGPRRRVPHPDVTTRFAAQDARQRSFGGLSHLQAARAPTLGTLRLGCDHWGRDGQNNICAPRERSNTPKSIRFTILRVLRRSTR